MVEKIILEERLKCLQVKGNDLKQDFLVTGGYIHAN